MSVRFEIIGKATVFCGDARDIVPTLGKVDAVVTDPPYGQKQKVNTFYAGGTRRKAVLQRNGSYLDVEATFYPPLQGDDQPYDPALVFGWSPLRLIWGAHKFADRLPRGSWLVWDKVPNGKVRSQGCGEAAWLSIPDRPLRMHRLLWDGLSVGAGARHEVTRGQKRVHPTQKPEILMRWCIQQLPIKGGVIGDPYMGAGSTGVAALQLGFGFMGVELEVQYFDVACRRLEAAQRLIERGAA